MPAGAADPRAFRSDLLPVEHFDERFSDENLAFWVPLIAETGRIEAAHRVLDVGCGTGGFARAIVETVGAKATGLDASPRFLAHAAELPAPRRGAVEWVEGDAEDLPFPDGSFDRVVLSLLLHQLPEPERAVAESFRVLAAGGVALVRTIAPEDAGARVPERYLPSMAAADRSRLPPIPLVESWLANAGFTELQRRRVLRNKPLNLPNEERQLLVEVRSRYAFVTEDELQDGLRRMHEDAGRAGEWIDPRPTYFVSAVRP